MDPKREHDMDKPQIETREPVGGLLGDAPSAVKKSVRATGRKPRRGRTGMRATS